MTHAQPERARRSDNKNSQPTGPSAPERRQGERSKMWEGWPLCGHGVQRALRAASIGYVDLQLPSGQRYYSNECLVVMGYGPQDREVFERGWLPLIHPHDVGTYVENRRRAFGGETDRFEEEIRRMRRDGSFGWLRCTGEVIERDTEGGTLRLVAMIEDVDARHRAEDELRQAHRQIQALSAHVERRLEAERKLIATELHDECGQVLTLMKMELSQLRAATQRAGRPAGPGEGAEAVERVDQRLVNAIDPLQERVQRLDAVLDELVQMSRNLITRLRPPALDLGLVPALEWLTQEWARRTGVACVFSGNLVGSQDDLVLPDEQATTLFRIVQESLTNVARHSKAEQVVVSLDHANARLDLCVADDGRGFDPAAQYAGHFGLLGMRERADRVGAHLDLRSRPGAGTQVCLWMPLPVTQVLPATHLEPAPLASGVVSDRCDFSPPPPNFQTTAESSSALKWPDRVASAAAADA